MNLSCLIFFLEAIVLVAKRPSTCSSRYTIITQPNFAISFCESAWMVKFGLDFPISSSNLAVTIAHLQLNLIIPRRDVSRSLVFVKRIVFNLVHF